jgi:zinc transport system substrate-binding protein
MITGTDINTTDLSTGISEPHELELTSKNVDDIDNASLLIYVPHSQGAIDSALEKGVEPDNTLKLNSASLHPWLNLPEMVNFTSAIYKNILEIAPSKDKDTIKTNSESVISELTKIRDEYSVLGSCKKRAIVVSHNAFSSFETLYNIKTYSVTGDDEGQEPSLKHIKNIEKAIKENKIKEVYYESDGDKSIMENIANDMKIELHFITPIETSDVDYFVALEQNLATLKSDLKCQSQ